MTLAKAAWATIGRCGLILAIPCILAAPASAAEAPAEPAGYRMSHFRAPVPRSLRGATVISNTEARALWEADEAIFIDVLPRPPKPAGLPEGTIWRVPPRHNIPASVWLPNVGFGALNAETETYYRDNLVRLTDGNNAAPVVIYCLANCWMSWNAAKRALSYGYTQVYWYPEGSDGWQTEAGSLEQATPIPMAP